MIPKALRDRARELRAASNPFEQSFWRHVRQRRLAGYRFRRQQVIGIYIVDFVCLDEKLIVELDGSQHADQEPYDQERDLWLSGQGYRVFRVWNNQWQESGQAVLDELLRLLASGSPNSK